MNKPIRFFLVAALLAPAIAPAQTTTTTTVLGVPASLEVSRLAPQLIAFAGSQVNFDNLVNGLALGTPVTISTQLPTGQVQITTFTPQGTMTPTLIAQTLESARQSLISRGIATPNSQQLAISLTGGALPTQTGNVLVAGALPVVNQPGQATAAAGATGTAFSNANTGATATTTTATTTTVANPNGLPSPAAIIQNQREGNISNTPSATSTPVPTAPVTAPASPLAPTPAAPAAPFGTPAR